MLCLDTKYPYARYTLSKFKQLTNTLNTLTPSSPSFQHHQHAHATRTPHPPQSTHRFNNKEALTESAGSVALGNASFIPSLKKM